MDPQIPSTVTSPEEDEEPTTSSTQTQNKSVEDTMLNALKQEDEFLEYIMSLPITKTTEPIEITTSNTDESKVGLDHLDNLCKLMEQLGELRDQNYKLNRRVQYLEDLRALQDMHKELKLKTSSSSNNNNKRINSSEESINNNNKTVVVVDSYNVPIIKSKVSKWTRVKEAFRWEKAHLEPVTMEAKSQDSGIGLGSLKVPSSNTESISPADSVLSYSAPLSSSSSSEDIMDIDLDFAALSEATEFTGHRNRNSERRHQENRRSLSPGDEMTRTGSHHHQSTHQQHNKILIDKKSIKTPWGKVKNIIQTRRDSLKHRGRHQQHRLGFSDDEGAGDDTALDTRRSRESSGGGDNKRPPMLTVTLPSTEDLHPHIKPIINSPDETRNTRFSRLSDPHGTRSKELYRRQSSLPRGVTASSLGTSPPPHRRPSKWTKVKKAFLTSKREEEQQQQQQLQHSPINTPISMPCSPHISAPFHFDHQHQQLKAEVEKNYEELQTRLSQEFNKKLDEFDSSCDFHKKLQEWEKIKSGGGDISPPPPPLPLPMPPPTQSQTNYHLSPQFRKRLLEWQIRRAVSGKADAHEESELHKGLPEDFTKKLQEWEKIKAGNKTSPRLSRKDSRNETHHDNKVKTSHKEKQLQWLEKELNKVEREKRRLEREREKFLERKARLESMRKAMNSPSDASGENKEILIQTSTGFFRFQGISEKFTRKLYEWEQQRGIAPEASTFALLDPKYRRETDTIEDEEEEEDIGNNINNSPGSTLIRSKSVGSVADAGLNNNGVTDIIHQSQQSSLSLNDVEALEAELEETRVSSEPRLRTDSLTRPRSRSNSKSTPRRPPPSVFLEPPSAVIVDVEDEIDETMQLEVIPALQTETPIWSVTSNEVTTLATASDEHRTITIQRGDSVRSASSYQLLEENMHLLAELKHKEAICRQLEAEMEQLERKLNDVAATQNRQMERLRLEETDRQDDEEQQPSEQRVARLRRSVMELGARRERLQRQGQALQDSFAQAWQQQAVLAQTLVGRARLLKQGVVEEQQNSNNSGSQSPATNINIAPCWPEDVCQYVLETPQQIQQQQQEIVQYQQDPVVAKVEELSTQLLALAEKLEKALSSRTIEIQNLRSELLRTPGANNPSWREKLRPPSGSDSHLSASLNSLETKEAEKFTVLTKHFLPRQSSEELAELPQLLTGKVLELKRGLSELCAVATTSRENEMMKPTENVTSYSHESKHETEDEEEGATATFVLRVGSWKKHASNETNVSFTLPIINQDMDQKQQDEDEEEKTPFWRRVPIKDRESSDEEEINKSKDMDKQHPRRCSLRRNSKLISEEVRDQWRQNQFVTTVSASTTQSAEAKKLKTRRVSDTHIAYNVADTASSSVPINVFVPTTRKIFSPIKTDESIVGYIISDSINNIPDSTNNNNNVAVNITPPWRRRDSINEHRRTRDSQSASPALQRKILSLSPENSPRPRRVSDKNGISLPPPFPRSPTPNRRGELIKNTKETSPSIKLMIAKYNKKLTDQPPINTTGGPVAGWRSPVAERRDLSGLVRTQTEKYQEEVRKALQEGFSSTRRPVAVQKSASAGLIHSQSVTKLPQREPPPLLKSSSAGTIKSPLLPLKRIPPPPPIRIPPIETIESNEPPKSPLDSSIDSTIENYRKNTITQKPISNTKSPSPCMRALKLKKARDEFLSRGPGALNMEAGSRLSHVSAGSGSSFEDLLLNNEGLVKSASAGMIHVQAEVFKRDENQPQQQTINECSEPTSNKSSNKFGLLNLASKFRKVRLRKKSRLNTVSTLCRQSLLVDINTSDEPSTSNTNNESISCPNSPVLQHKTIWIKRHKHQK